MKLNVYFAWYDIWVGAYWAGVTRTLYICPLPMIVFCFRFGRKPKV